jgi:hypothetical protein
MFDIGFVNQMRQEARNNKCDIVPISKDTEIGVEAETSDRTSREPSSLVYSGNVVGNPIPHIHDLIDQLGFAPSLGVQAALNFTVPNAPTLMLYCTKGIEKITHE